jgi:hypothetical protein
VIGENMETLALVLGWTSYILNWAWALWMVLGTLVGGVLIARDERRLHGTRPKPEAVRAYADQLEAEHGREAFRLNGEAMHEARLTKDFDRYRFLKEVSGELVARLVSRSATSE